LPKVFIFDFDKLEKIGENADNIAKTEEKAKINWVSNK
jgi:hypothetical protein